MLDREEASLASYAMHSRDSAGRKIAEPLHPYRGPFQRDRDRILHSSAFRRLSGKMQVFTGDMGDYHRTRLTHTFEVSSIARTVSRVLRLNEDLVEALALMHDIGHPPYGHCGEDVLDEALTGHGGFSHNRFALTIVEELEQRHTQVAGLNLSSEMLEGQRTRADKAGAAAARQSPLLEIQVVDACDSIAYNAHDTDDALQLGLLPLDELRHLPLVDRAVRRVQERYGTLSHARMRPAIVHELIDIQVSDFITTNKQLLTDCVGLKAREVTAAGIRLEHSRRISTEREELGRFLFERVYRHPRLLSVRDSAGKRLQQLFDLLVASPERLPLRFRTRADQHGVQQAAAEYIAGMTDRFCSAQHDYATSSGGPLADWS